MALQKLLAAVGVGSATIDAILDEDRVVVGGTLSGVLRIRGGSVEQKADRVLLDVSTYVQREVNDSTVKEARVVHRQELAGPFVIPPNGQHEVRFAFQVPFHTPVTVPGSRYPIWLRSGLDIPFALDPSDQDMIEVLPTSSMANVLTAMERLGFRLYKADVEHRPRWRGGVGFVQEFEFRPVHRGQRHLDEVEVVFLGESSHNVEVLLQIDRAARGLAGLLMEATGTDESWRHVYIPAHSVEVAAQALGRLLP